MQRSANKNVQRIAMVGVMTAIVFVMTGLRILLPSPDGKAAIHFGNIMCLLAGLLFGGVNGGISAGMGSMLYDFTNPLYIKDAPFTFINKFAMGFVAGILCTRLKIKSILLKSIISATCGQLTYLILYLSKSYIFDIYFYRNARETALANLFTKGISSGFNAVVAIICSVLLYSIIRKLLLATPFKSMIK